MCGTPRQWLPADRVVRPARHLVAQQPDTTYLLTDLGRGALALRPLVRWSNAWASALNEDGGKPVP